MIDTAARKAGGQELGEPSGVAAQLKRRIRSTISPPPARNASSSLITMPLSSRPTGGSVLCSDPAEQRHYSSKFVPTAHAGFKVRLPPTQTGQGGFAGLEHR